MWFHSGKYDRILVSGSRSKESLRQSFDEKAEFEIADQVVQWLKSKGKERIRREGTEARLVDSPTSEDSEFPDPEIMIVYPFQCFATKKHRSEEQLRSEGQLHFVLIQYVQNTFQCTDAQNQNKQLQKLLKMYNGTQNRQNTEFQMRNRAS
ncbi:hypothetical protein SCHPADRAFT_987848 [Schizopora paradoxa]|uniref:Uncharacterized protein n=1 Tax=Schizopora paradoxa TaxID=27342 RepID=A0A0H2R1T9_9AGAM|nr:hypothetical protein SCHPADRAFT_987848 [Schizopora paradoxa]